MESMPQFADSHTISVRGVAFEVLANVFAKLVEIPLVLDSQASVDQVNGALDVGTFGSASPIEDE